VLASILLKARPFFPWKRLVNTASPRWSSNSFSFSPFDPPFLSWVLFSSFQFRGSVQIPPSSPLNRLPSSVVDVSPPDLDARAPFAFWLTAELLCTPKISQLSRFFGHTYSPPWPVTLFVHVSIPFFQRPPPPFSLPLKHPTLQYRQSL